MTSFHYISPTELSELMKSGKKPMKDYAIIDVRDDDFIGGNIVGCIQAPSLKFLETVDNLVSKTKDVPIIIFHCTLSQLRGPKAATIYDETRTNMSEPGGSLPPQEIHVLQGGFAGFQDLFKGDPLLVEQWRKEVWEDCINDVLEED
ncbi:unnamed protein product [Rhizoctonia solani]|uniref:Rhodanese domain-containing protein n=1 Tax=Rhizoctonia solani TaxID=456999 RepID=A0A8H3CT95_9AGAM|nr:unnamed protein product [Rhizoctonia solani]